MKGNTTAETRHDMVKAEEERELIGTNLYLFFIFYFILFYFFFFFFFLLFPSSYISLSILSGIITAEGSVID